MSLFNFDEDKNLEDYTASELKDELRQANDLLGLEPGDTAYLKTSGAKDKLIEQILEAQEFTSPQNTGKVTGDSEFTNVLPRQVIVHEGNYRDEVDYYDPQLRAAFRNSNYKFLHNLVVTPTGDETEDGLPLFRIVSGNRSFSNWRAVCEEDGVDTSELPIPANIRHYDGSEKEKLISEAIEMGQANELQRAMSPVQLMRWYKDLQRAGYTQEQIAVIQYGQANAKGKQSIVSQVLGLERLPELVLDLIHYGFHANDLAANGQEFLEEHDIPFEVDDNDELVVFGITMNNAKTMMKLYPRRGSKNETVNVEEVNSFLMSDPLILDNAMFMTNGAFKSDLRRRAIEAGLVDPPKQKTSDEETVAETSSGIEKPKTKAKPDYMDHPVTRDEAQIMFDNEEYQLADDWQKKVAALLWEDEEGVYQAVLCLAYNGILREV